MNAIKIFYSYARLDKRLRDELEKHLEPLKRSGQIITWYDREIQPGNDWEHEIKNQLDTADIILLLLSPNFVSSNYCYGQEMQQALERQKRGDVCIIPIVLRPVSWQELPIGNLQALPSDGKPVSTWRHRGEAFEDIVRGISQVVSAFQRLRTSQDAEREEEKKTSSQAQQLSLFTNELLAKMNIAGRTPLMALYGYLELLARTHERLDAQGRSRILSRARDSQKEAISISDRLLHLLILPNQPIWKKLQLAAVVHNLVQHLDQQYQEGYPLEVDIPENIVIKADEKYIQEIFNNFLSNIWMYTPVGTQVRISALLVMESGELLGSSTPMTQVCVKDFGPGIPPDELPLLFTAFRRLPRDLPGKISGLGLGLYVNKQLVETLGGHIWAESTGIPGEGSCFCFTLPVE